MPVSGISVIIIDDDSVDRELVRRSLGADFVVDEASTAAEGLEQIAARSPQCVVLDYRLPDASGLELLERVVRQDPQVAIVMLTGQGDESVAVAAIRGGAHDYLVKDKLDGLAVAIRNAIHRKDVENTLADHRENAPSGGKPKAALWVTSADGSFVEYASVAYEELWGRPAQALYDAPNDWLKAVTPQSRERAEKLADHGRLKSVIEVEYDIGVPGGDARRIVDRAIPIRDSEDRVQRVLRLAVDVTSVRRLEKHLVQALEGGGGALPGPVVVEVSLADLQAGMVLVEDVRATNGLCVVPRGQEITAALRTRIQSFASNIGIEQPLRVVSGWGAPPLAPEHSAAAFKRA